MYSLISRDRPKSAPYPMLKNSKRTSKSQFTVIQNRKSKKNGPSGAPGPASASPWRAKRGTLPKLSTFLSQVPFGEKTNFRKKISVPKKTERGTLWGFPTSIVSQNRKKIEGGTLWGKIFSAKKVSQCRKKLKGGTLWSRPVWYVTRENRKNLFGSVR